MSIPSTTIDAAIRAVQRASSLTTAAQGRLLAGDTLTKGDDSPVTVADFAAQAVVCATLQEHLPDMRVVGEEDATDLTGPDQAPMLDGVTDLVAGAMARTVDSSEVLDWIALGSAAATGDRYWTLDPIDGTKGFLRGDQYAIALALIEEGEVVLGVLGCPNLPNPDGTTGALFVAANGSATVALGGSERRVPVAVDAVADVSRARFCESVESGHSDQSQSAEIARTAGDRDSAVPRRQPVQVRSRRPRRRVDLPASPDESRLRREDLGSRCGQVRRRAGRRARHRRQRGRPRFRAGERGCRPTPV